MDKKSGISREFEEYQKTIERRKRLGYEFKFEMSSINAFEGENYEGIQHYEAYEELDSFERALTFLKENIKGPGGLKDKAKRSLNYWKNKTKGLWRQEGSKLIIEDDGSSEVEKLKKAYEEYRYWVNAQKHPGRFIAEQQTSTKKELANITQGFDNLDRILASKGFGLNEQEAELYGRIMDTIENDADAKAAYDAYMALPGVGRTNIWTAFQLINRFIENDDKDVLFDS